MGTGKIATKPPTEVSIDAAEGMEVKVAHNLGPLKVRELSHGGLEPVRKKRSDEVGSPTVPSETVPLFEMKSAMSNFLR